MDNNGMKTRRDLLATGAALAVGTTTAQLLPSPTHAQGAADPELARLQGARRILFKGAVVLTMGQQDFAPGDVLVEDGKIREIRPDIAAAGDMVVIDAANRILVPGFVDTHSHSYQGILRSILPNGRVDPDYNAMSRTSSRPPMNQTTSMRAS